MERADRDDWDRHWEDYSETAALNPAQQYRRQLIHEAVRGRDPKTLVDLGSGTGDLIAELGAACPDAALLGVEISERGVALSRRRAPQAEFVRQDLLQPVRDAGTWGGRAECATCSEVLEHLDDPAMFLRNATSFMAPGCTLIVTVPGGPMSAFDRHIGHRKHYSPEELRALLGESGFAVERVEGAGFPFFNLYRLLVILRGRKLIGDVASAGDGSVKGAAAVAMRLFALLFRMNRNRGRRGWQTLAVAKWPGGSAGG